MKLPDRMQSVVHEVSRSCGIAPEAAAVALCGALGGISGKWEGCRDNVGTVLSPRFNLVAAMPPGPSGRRFRMALTGRIEAEARALAEARQLLDPKLAERMMGTLQKRATEALKDRERANPFLFGDPFIAAGSEAGRIQAIRQPVIFLRSPDRQEIHAGLQKSAERTLLLDFLDEDLLARFLRGRQRDWNLLDLLAKLMGGGQVFAGSEIVPARVACFVGATSESLRRAIVARDRRLSALLSHCAFLDLERNDGDYDTGATAVTGTSWPRLVQEFIFRRRCVAGGYTLLNEAASMPRSFSAYDKFLAERLEEVQKELRYLFSGAWAWPFKLFPVLLASRNRGTPEAVEQILEAVEALARWLVDHQIEVLKQISGTTDQLTADEARMIQKLERSGPATFRTLLRAYSTQRTDLHQPTLDRLLKLGRVRLNADGLLEAVDVNKEDAA